MGPPELILEKCIPKKEPIPSVDPIPAWIRIQVIPTPALMDMVPAPDLDPLKSGIVTPLEPTPCDSNSGNHPKPSLSASYQLNWPANLTRHTLQKELRN